MARCFKEFLPELNNFFFLPLQLFPCFHVPSGMSRRYNHTPKDESGLQVAEVKLLAIVKNRIKCSGWRISCKARGVAVCQCTS